MRIIINDEVGVYTKLEDLSENQVLFVTPYKFMTVLNLEDLEEMTNSGNIRLLITYRESVVNFFVFNYKINSTTRELEIEVVSMGDSFCLSASEIAQENIILLLDKLKLKKVKWRVSIKSLMKNNTMFKLIYSLTSLGINARNIELINL